MRSKSVLEGPQRKISQIEHIDGRLFIRLQNRPRHKLLDLVITEQKNDLKLSGILPLGEDDHERMSPTLHLEPSKTVVICRRNCSKVNMVEIVSATEGLDRE